MGNHMPYMEPTVLPATDDFPTFIPAEAGTQISDHGGMQGWVDLDYIPR